MAEQPDFHAALNLHASSLLLDRLGVKTAASAFVLSRPHHRAAASCAVPEEAGEPIISHHGERFGASAGQGRTLYRLRKNPSHLSS